ncbi:4Fe-4S binding protein, partial [bacterium]|nr:4Fe-4S binding protein [bacterium]
MNTRRQRLRRGLLVAFFLLLPVTLNYYSPYLMTTGTAERVASFSLVLWVGMLATAPVLGRSFCGWACPFHGLQLLVEKVAARPTRQVRFTRWIKYALWVAWAVAVAAIAVSVGGWTRFEPLYFTEHYVSFDRPEALVIYFGLIALVLGGLAWGKRGFCHYLCPFGVWNIVGEWLGHLVGSP